MLLNPNELNELYQSIVLENYKNPHNFYPMEKVSPIIGKNPSCGDHIELYVDLDKINQTVNNISFTGEGCALCIASTSLMSNYFKQKSIQEIKETISNFSDLISGKQEHMNSSEYEELEIFKNVHNFPSRAKCAMLGWRALEKSIE